MSNLKFELDSKFFKEISNRYDELLIYKSNYIDFLLSQEDFTNEIENPNTVTQSKWLYLNSIKNFAKQREVFSIEAYASYTAEGVDGDAYDVGFNIAETALDKIIVDGKFQSKKNLIIKFTKGLKITANINNMESVLLGSLDNDIKDINTVDYSKTVIELKNFEKLNNTISKTSNSYNQEYSKHFNNMIKNLKIRKVQNSLTETVSSDFSQTLGFSIKSLSYSDIVNLDLEKVEVETIKIEGKDLADLMRNTLNNKAWKSESLPINFVDWIKANTLEDTNNNRVYLNQSLKAGKYLDGLIEIQVNKAKAWDEITPLERYTLIYNKKILDDSLFNQDTYYTLAYFSAFKSKDSKDENEKTYFKKSVQSNHVVEVVGNNDNKFTATPLKNKSTTTYNFDIATFSDEEFRKRIKNLTYRVDNIGTSDKQRSLIDKINAKINSKKSDISRFLRSFRVDTQTGSLEILVDNIVVLDNKSEYLSFKLFTKNKLINPDDFHFFVPEICLETLTGRTLLEKNIVYKEDNFLLGNDFSDGAKLGKKYQILYRITLDEIYKNLQTTNKKSLRSLTPFYDSKWAYYRYQVNYKRMQVGKDGNVVYPIFYNNMSWSEGATEISNDGIQSFVGNPEISVNGIKINATGGSKGIQTKKGNIDNSKKEEALEGPSEKVLKISAVASSLEFKRLSNVFDNARSSNTETEAAIADLIIAKKPEVDEVNFIFDFVTLNGIDKDNPKGKNNAKGYDYVSYVNKKRNVYEFRRCNVQPRLIKLINTAVEITQTKYPSLQKAEIMSMGSPPASFAAYVYILTKNGNNAEQITKILNSLEGFENVKLNKDNLSDIVRGFNKYGTDNNHSNGLAADIYLVRREEGGGKKYVCLYSPVDDKDFEIVNTFLTVCRGLGASGLGAGMYYMDEPEPIMHMTKVEVSKLKNSKNKYIKEKGDMLAALYDELGIRYANKNEDKIIIDEEGIPIRPKNIRKLNAFHVDILSNVYSFFDDSNMSKNYFTLDLSSNFIKSASEDKEISKKLSKTAKKKIRKFFIDVENYKKFKKDSSKKLSSKKRVWGSNSSAETADKWLLDIIDDQRSTSGEYNVDKITLDNFKEINKKQFEVSHKPEKNKSGDIVSKYVSVKDIKK